MALAERDRGPRGDAGAASSLWIDFLLLPEKLEEHLQALAAGVVAAPTPPDLITVFLEQALMNYKSCTQSSAVGNNVKDTVCLVSETLLSFFSILGTHLFAVLYNAVRLVAQARIQKDSMKSFVPVLGFCLLGLEMVAKSVEGILVVQFLLVCLSP